jgi:alkylation response protein AidB-like acyl-CoA dehydrogenase
LGLSRELGQLVAERLRRAGAPDWLSRNPIGYGMGAPTIAALGSADQKRRYLRRLFTCEDIWCQLFSEPGAGSDLAALSTRALRDGDEWIVNGQKVWSTMGSLARYGMLLARTDPDAPKHQGLTYFVLDMGQPGVEVRPLRQLTGDAEFNEVYFTDARIPDTERLGAVGEGWRTAIVTLLNERDAVGGGLVTNDIEPIDVAIDVWKTTARRPVLRDRLVRLWVEAEALRVTTLRAAHKLEGGNPGPEGAILKLARSQLVQQTFEFCVDAQGPTGQLFGSYEMRVPVPGERLWFSEDARWMFLRSRSFTIGGGTSEIMRNILGERILGLPGDIRVDKDQPWSRVPRQ